MPANEKREETKRREVRLRRETLLRLDLVARAREVDASLIVQEILDAQLPPIPREYAPLAS
jgi:hypothetical protein